MLTAQTQLWIDRPIPTKPQRPFVQTVCGLFGSSSQQGVDNFLNKFILNILQEADGWSENCGMWIHFFCELFRVSIVIVDPFTSSLIKDASLGVSISVTSSIASFSLLGGVILKCWLNFTGKDGTLSGEEAAVVVVVFGVVVVVSVVVVVLVVDAAAVRHKVWEGLSNRFIKLSLLNFPCPGAAVCIRNLGGSKFSFNWSVSCQKWGLPRPILMSDFLKKFTSTVLASKVVATQGPKAANRKIPFLFVVEAADIENS
jgi:hypothetical protein